LLFVTVSVAAFVLAVSFFGCTNIHVEEGGLSGTPYADEETLSAISARAGFVNWKVARFFALNELDDSRDALSWHGTQLSDYPMVIYNAQTGEPRYYEFRVIADGSEVGAITCAAEKSEGIPVQFVLPFAKQVSEQNMRAVSAQSGKVIDSGYPGRLLIRQTGTQRSVDAVTGAEDSGEYPVDVNVSDFLLNADSATLEAMGITGAEIYEQYLAQEFEKEAQVGAFWEEVDALTEKIVSMTEEELKQAFGEDAGAARSIISTSTSQYILQDWYNKRDWHNPRGYCGPNVISFIMLGLGTKSGYSGIPTANNPNQLDAFYQAVQNKIGAGATYYLFPLATKLSLCDGLKTLTNDRYRLDPYTAKILWYTVADHSWARIDSSIRNNNLPVVSLRTFTYAKVRDEDDWQFHYRAIIGTKSTITSLTIKIFWWTVTSRLLECEKQYLMHDNTTDGGNWWEGWKLYQFQAAGVLKN
jgi:hypothetical protein